MSQSLKTRVTGFIIVVIVASSIISTALTLSTQREQIERELLARGIALSEALSRAVNEGLAMENLSLIKEVEQIVHTRDVLLTQVFSVVWLGIASVPVEQLNLPPDPAAVEHFKGRHETSEEVPFALEGNRWIEIYAPVYYYPHDERIERTILTGYIRLRISKEGMQESLRRAVASSVAVAAVLTFVAVIVLNILLQKYVIGPILRLHASVEQHRQGKFTEAIPVLRRDEIGGLSADFNEMSRELREREERLAEEKERLAVTLRSIGDGVIVTDVNGKVTLINKVAETLTGWESAEAVGRPLTTVFCIINERSRDRCEDPVEKVIRSGQIVGLANHTALVRRDGTEIVIEDSAAPIRDRESRVVGVVLVFRDMTEKRRIEEERIRTEKLQSVGLLAGGLAHDFNNLLTSITGNISVAKMYAGEGNNVHERLNDAEIAAQRAAELTSQLLTFSRGGSPIKQTASIAEIIRESSRFTLAGTAVAAEYQVPPDVWSVSVDAGQMSQVFNNLTINAVHAMPGGGTIRFSVDNEVIGADQVPPLPAGRYVRVAVEDTGGGIAPEHLQRIFEPYFTTKDRGSGLGLASVHSIVRNHDGHIAVFSRPGQGTTFVIYLPASEDQAEQRSSGDQGIVPGKGKVLVMDDEDVVRSVSGEILSALGYEPAFARDGAEAISLYRQALARGERFDIVVMDLTVPGGMGGKETLSRLKEIDPAIKAIVSSGYSNDRIMADFQEHGFHGVIVKPYTIAAFSKVLQKVMQAP